MPTRFFRAIFRLRRPPAANCTIAIPFERPICAKCPLLLDEGHCFRDQLVNFCHLKSARRSQRSYHLGSIETFMRMVESGLGATFIPELSTFQLSEEQKRLVRPFAVPVPTREIVLLTAQDFVRESMRRLLVDEIRAAVPPSMHRLTHAQKSI